MRKEIRDFLNAPKNKKRHNTMILSGARRNPNRPPSGFNHWPTFEEIVQVLGKRVHKEEIDKAEIERLNYEIIDEKSKPQKDEAMEKLLKQLGVK